MSNALEKNAALMFGSTAESGPEIPDWEATVVEIRHGLANALKVQRNRRGMTQEQLETFLGASRSRIARMEEADSSVSVDLVICSLLRMGASRKDVASYIAAPPPESWVINPQ